MEVRRLLKRLLNKKALKMHGLQGLRKKKQTEETDFIFISQFSPLSGDKEGPN